MTHIKKIVLFAVLFGASLPAAAAYSWAFDSGAGKCSVPNTTTTSCTVTSTGPTVTATMYSNTNGSGSNADLYTLETGYMGVYSGGIGEHNRDGCSSGSTCDVGDLYSAAPEHAIDNNQRYDSVLLNFASSVKLNSMSIGWKGTDSDMTVLAYTGTGTCTATGTCSSSLAGKKYADLTSFGWSLIGHYGNVAVDAATGINAGNVNSKFWLIGAFNPLVNGSTLGWGRDDAVKLKSIVADVPTSVPEPASLALVGLGLAAISRLRRR